MDSHGLRSSKPPRRRAFSTWGALVGLTLVVVLPALGFSLFARLRGQSEESGPLMHTVQKGDFLHDITERGELESASNVEISCEVKSRNMAGTTILDIVPEGTIVKAGDLICRLDSSALESERLGKLIDVSNSEANVIRAKTALANATLAKEEYLRGNYVQSEKKLSAALAVAKEDLRRAEEYLEYSKTLKSKGYITSAQLQADSFAVEKARNTLEACQVEYDGLERYTLKKMTTQLQTDVEVAQAQLKSQEHAFTLEKEKLNDIETQISRCTINAPSAGQVVYANVTNTWGGREVIIEAGSTVRERQSIARLPDHTKMQVRAKVNEGKIAMVMVGMSATVRLDAMPDRTFPAEVDRVSEYPAPASRYTSSVKEYETIVRILEPPPGARPGLTAEVKIHLEHLADVLQVPVQAVIEHGERYYVAMRAEKGLRPHEVKLGSTNDKTVVIRDGLRAGDQVVLNATAVRSALDLPELPPERSGLQLAGRRRAGPKSRAGREATAGEESRAGTIVDSGPAETRKEPGPAPAELFVSFDKNGDGKLDPAEIPESYRDLAKSADANGDGAVDRTEWTAAMANGDRSPRSEARAPRARP